MADSSDDFHVSDPRFDRDDTIEASADSSVPYREEKPRSGCGCFVWGCLGTVVVLLLLVAIATISSYRWVKAQAQALTAEAPVEIPIVELPEEEAVAVQQRFDAFADAFEAGDTPEELELTADEINGLIAANKDLRGRVLVRIEGGRVGGDVSLPIDKDLPLVGSLVGGRYLNATIDAEVSLRDGKLVVRLVGGSVNGMAIPQAAIDALAEENLAKDVEREPEVAEVLDRFESIEVRDDRIVLRPRREPEEQADLAAEIETFEDPAGVE